MLVWFQSSIGPIWLLEMPNCLGLIRLRFKHEIGPNWTMLTPIYDNRIIVHQYNDKLHFLNQCFLIALVGDGVVQNCLDV